MTAIKMTVFLNVTDATAKAFLQGTPQQRYQDLISLMEQDLDVSFSEPELVQHEDIASGAATKDLLNEDLRTPDGALPASSHEGVH